MTVGQILEVISENTTVEIWGRKNNEYILKDRYGGKKNIKHNLDDCEVAEITVSNKILLIGINL